MDRKNFDQMFDDAFDENPDNAEGQPPSTAKRQLRQKSNKFKLILVMAASLLFGAVIVSLPFAKKAEESKPLSSQAGAVATERTPAQIEKMLFANKGHQRTTVYVKKQKNTLLPMPPPDAPEDHSIFLDPDRYVRNNDFPEDSIYESELIDTKTGEVKSRTIKEELYPHYEYDNWSSVLANFDRPMPEFTYLPEGYTETIGVSTNYGMRTSFRRNLYYPEFDGRLHIYVQWNNPESNYPVAENYGNEIRVEDISLSNGLEGVIVYFVNHDAFELLCLYNHVNYKIFGHNIAKEELIKIVESIRPAPPPDPSLFEIPEEYKKRYKELR